MLKGFKAFVLRGNVIDLAVAVAVGAALAALVATFTESLINPIVGWILSLLPGESNQIGGTWVLADGYEINFTSLITGFITFFVTLIVLYFIFVAPMNRYRRMTGKGEVDTRPPDVVLLTEIRDLLVAQAERDAQRNTKGTGDS
jgi:large conductance mechanosensitive channel